MKLHAGVIALCRPPCLSRRPLAPRRRTNGSSSARGFTAGFGPFIPVGIRVGLDALARLKAEPRSVTVTFYSGAEGAVSVHCRRRHDRDRRPVRGRARCRSPPRRRRTGVLAVIMVRDRKGSASVRYTVKDEWLPEVAGLAQVARPDGPLSGGHGGRGVVRGDARRANKAVIRRAGKSKSCAD